MNEFNEMAPYESRVHEFVSSSEQKDSQFNLHDIVEGVKGYIDSVENFIKGIGSDTGKLEETGNVREYGLTECSDAAKEIFTTKVISEWGGMSAEKRNEIVQDYAKAIGEGLNIDFKGIIFEPLIDQMGALGYNSGDGYIHLDYCYINDPGQVIGLIDTVAHEARHQFQSEAINNPEKFGVDQATINEWKAGMANYTSSAPTAYDPWGYFYNPVEIDARYFGESMVRELTKDIINKA